MDRRGGTVLRLRTLVSLALAIGFVLYFAERRLLKNKA